MNECINTNGIVVRMFVANIQKNGSIFPMNIPRKSSSSLDAFASTKINIHGVHGRIRAQLSSFALKNISATGMTVAIITAIAMNPTIKPNCKLPRRIYSDSTL